MPRTLFTVFPVAAAVLAAPIMAPSAAAAETVSCDTICIQDVRTATHDSYDRMVIDLSEGTLPRWTANTEPGPLYFRSEEGGGRPVPIEGKSYLTVTLTPAKAYDNNYQPTYTGPVYENFSYPSLKGQAHIHSFEDSNTFGLALGDHTSYKVFQLKSPNRIVIDINH